MRFSSNQGSNNRLVLDEHDHDHDDQQSEESEISLVEKTNQIFENQKEFQNF